MGRERRDDDPVAVVLFVPIGEVREFLNRGDQQSDVNESHLLAHFLPDFGGRSAPHELLEWAVVFHRRLQLSQLPVEFRRRRAPLRPRRLPLGRGHPVVPRVPHPEDRFPIEELGHGVDLFAGFELLHLDEIEPFAPARLDGVQKGEPLREMDPVGDRRQRRDLQQFIAVRERLRRRRPPVLEDREAGRMGDGFEGDADEHFDQRPAAPERSPEPVQRQRIGEGGAGLPFAQGQRRPQRQRRAEIAALRDQRDRSPHQHPALPVPIA